jgi:trimethylamine corrinoid protein
MSDKSELFARMRQAVLDGDDGAAADLARHALDTGIPPLDAVEQGFVPGVREAGRLWEEGEYFLPELVTSAEAMKAAMTVVMPRLGEAGRQASEGCVIIGTVQGDIHDIGKTLVATMLSANGFTVHDEGADVPVEQFVKRAQEVSADLICASALLTTTMTRQRDLVAAVREAGLPGRVMVGGAPVHEEWVHEIGADGYAGSAVSAVDEARRLMTLT